jgi:hypothetical protein
VVSAADLDRVEPPSLVSAWIDLMLVFLATVYVTVPVLTFIHELAHAAVAVRLSGQRVMVRIGRRHDALIRFARGRIDVRWQPTGQIDTAHMEFAATLTSPRQLFWISLAGPAGGALAFMLLAVLTWWIGDSQGIGVPFWIALVATVAALADGVVNLIPLHEPPRWAANQEAGGSDGWLVREAWRYRGTPLWSKRFCDHPPEPVAWRLETAAKEALGHGVWIARTTGAAAVGTTHLLAGLLIQGAVSSAFSRAGVDIATLEGSLPQLEAGATPTLDKAPAPAPALKAVLDRACADGHEASPADLARALVNEPGSPASARIVDAGGKRARLLVLLAETPAQQAA